MKNRHVSKIIDILLCFLDDYKKTLTGREIARKTSLNHQTIFNHLRLNKDIFKYNPVGKNHEYYLDLSNPKSIMHLSIAEKQKSLDIMENKEIEILINDLTGYFETLIIYGSFAKNEQKKDSDIDIIFLGKTKIEEVKKIIARYPREINYEVLSHNELKRKINSPLFQEIRKKHAIFGNTTNIIKLFSK